MTLEPCQPPLVISGPASVCLTGSYSVSTGQSVKWVVSSGFSVSPSTGATTTVTATGPHQYKGLLSAEINGVKGYFDITTCDFIIEGPNSFCTTGTYSLTNGKSATWNVSSGFTTWPNTGASTTVTVSGPLGQNGTLSATVDGVTATKNISSCSITGPSTICSNGSYSLSSNEYATWSVSNGFSVSPTNGASTTVTALSSDGLSGTLTAKVGNTTITKSITSCDLSAPYIDGPDVICPPHEFVFTLFGETAVYWVASPPETFKLADSDETTATVKALVNQGQSGAIVAIVDNSTGKAVIKPLKVCGRGAFYTASYIIVFHNPVNDILTVGIDADAARTLLSVKESLIFDVMLYDVQGNLLEQISSKGGTVLFNTSSLPDGVYLLHVFDGINRTPETKVIIIER